MVRKRRIWLLPLLMLAAIGSMAVWKTVVAIQQEQKNRALIAATKQNDLPAVIGLLNRGADPNARDLPQEARSFWQHLMDTLRGTHKIRKNAPPALIVALDCNHDYRQVVLVDTSRYNTPVVKVLLEHGADPNAMDSEGATALTLALFWDHPAYTLLLDHGANVNAHNRGGGTALMRAAHNGDPQQIRALLEHGAEVNVRDDNNETPLMMYMDWGDPAVVKLFLQHGAEVNIRSRSGWTALDTARLRDNLAAVRLLKQAGEKE